MAQFLPEGVVVAECGDGSAALEAYEEFQPEVVLMDVEMPVLDGISATRSLIERHPEARVVILTQHESPEMERAALEAGAVAFQPKSDLGSLPGNTFSVIRKRLPHLHLEEQCPHRLQLHLLFRSPGTSCVVC